MRPVCSGDLLCLISTERLHKLHIGACGLLQLFAAKVCSLHSSLEVGTPLLGPAQVRLFASAERSDSTGPRVSAARRWLV